MNYKQLLAMQVAIQEFVLDGMSFEEALQTLESLDENGINAVLDNCIKAATKAVYNGTRSYGVTLDRLILSNYVAEQGFSGEMRLFGYTPEETICEFDL